MGAFSSGLKKEPTIDVITVPTLFECIQYIAGYDADHAREQNGVGFNSNDTDLGNELARKDYEHWFNWQREWAFRKIRFYKRQLTEGGLRWDLVPEPTLRKMPDPIKKVSIVDNSYHVEFAHLGPDFEPVRAAISQIPGRYFDAKGGFWRIPMDSLGARGLRQFAAAHDFTLPDDVVESLYKVVDRGPLMSKGSRAVRPFTDMPLPDHGGSLTPWDHQQAGRQYGKLTGYRLLISDEMGTGKTGLALLMAEDAGVFEKDDLGRSGMLVICPASVKINWAREVAMWLPGKTVRILKGTGLQSVKADVLIANYDIMKPSNGPDFDEDGMPQGDLGKLLKLRKVKMLVCDECHYIKEPDAQRTVAIRQLVKAINPPYRVMLSGSPILNRVGEFATALDLAGMLDSFGGAYRFLSQYGGRDRSRLKEMNEKLREAGDLCRLKDHHAITPDGRFVHIRAVPEWAAPTELRKRLDDPTEDRLQVERLRVHMRQMGYELEEGAMKLPEKMPPQLDTLELSNRHEYDRALAEFRAWLWEMIQLSGGDIHAFNRAMKAEALVKLNKLRLLVGIGKAEGTIAWVKNFLDSTDEKLVVFVEHDIPQDAIADAFPGCAIITGGQSVETRQRNIDRFQNEDTCRLVVAKTKAGGVGITLTAASHVAILELPWNPGTLDQAIDRVHRGGQVSTVFPHYLLAENTIDQKMATLIDEKREIVTAAIQGGDVESESMLNSMLEDLAA